MKRLLLLVTIGSILFSGCDRILDPVSQSRVYDNVPPGAPTGVYTSTGDNFIELFWRQNPENDVAGYNVFVSSSYNGRYELIGSTKTTYFLDNGARNGNIYYYAVTAYDFDGNESALSRDVAYDIPRPEGYDVVLNDYRQTPNSAGYDFSTYAVMPFDAQNTDMYFENYNGAFFMNVYKDTDIQDMGRTNSLLDVGVAPDAGWSLTHDARLYVGHTYVVWTHDDHYAKFRVTSISPNRVVFDWAYQIVKSNPLLKRAAANGGPRNVVQNPNSRQ
jgi:hypothetical protein